VAAATGTGEQFIRHSIAAKVTWLMEDRTLPIDQAIRYCLDDILEPGDGRLIP
jgi:beta-aspartyl-peptidase (threonine type)